MKKRINNNQYEIYVASCSIILPVIAFMLFVVLLTNFIFGMTVLGFLQTSNFSRAILESSQMKSQVIPVCPIPLKSINGFLTPEELEDIDEQIEEELKTGDMELLAQLAQAEAGNQGVTGMRYVIRVVLNRVNSPRFPNTVEDVIFSPGAFGVITDGAFDRAAWNMSDAAFEAVELEMNDCIDSGILFFNTLPTNGKNHFKYKNHYFGY